MKSQMKLLWFEAECWHKPKVVLTRLCNSHSCELQQCVVTAPFLCVKCLSMNFSLFVLQIKISARCGRIRSRSEVGMRSLHIKFYRINKRDSWRFEQSQKGDAVIPKWTLIFAWWPNKPTTPNYAQNNFRQIRLLAFLIKTEYFLSLSLKAHLRARELKARELGSEIKTFTHPYQLALLTILDVHFPLFRSLHFPVTSCGRESIWIFNYRHLGIVVYLQRR